MRNHQGLRATVWTLKTESGQSGPVVTLASPAIDGALVSRRLGNDNWQTVIHTINNKTHGWALPDGVLPGICVLHTIITPASAVRNPDTGDDREIKFASSPQPGKATEVNVFVTTTEVATASAEDLEETDGATIARLPLANGETLWVTQRSIEESYLVDLAVDQRKILWPLPVDDQALHVLSGAVLLVRDDGTGAIVDAGM